MKTRRNSIISSTIAIVLCIAMLAGTTFAWFTDSVTSSGNIIKSGNLDVEMLWANDLTSGQWNDASSGAIFAYDKWEPGYTDVKYVKITNKGNLNLKWKLTIEAEGQVTKLSDVIDVYYVNPAQTELTSLDGLTSAGKLTKVLAEKTNSTGALTPNQTVTVAIALHMDDLAGNEYQNLSLCDAGFSVKLVAAQDVGEEDAFGDDYDANADWGETVNFAASTAITSSDLVYGALANEMTIGTTDGISAKVPANVKIADGATSLDLTVKAVDTNSNITLGEGESAKSLDVHIEGIASNNTQPMIINLGAFLEKGLGDTEVKLYHTENGIPVSMTRVASEADFAIHNQFTYDPATGNVSIYIASFSAITATKVTSSKWDGTVDTAWYDDHKDRTEFNILTASEFAGFRAIVDGGYYDENRIWVEKTQDSFDGKIVNLAVDIDLQGRLFDPIGKGYAHQNGQVFMGTFDGKGHTIAGLYQNGWDLDPKPGVYDTYTYSTAGGGLFASVKDATIKNLTISGADIVFECVDMGIVVGYAQGECTFENIIVTDSKIANYQRYTGGVVGEVSFGTDGDDADEFTHVFRNIVVDSSVTISSLWGDFDNSCGGVLGGKWGTAKVLMENVMVACRIDAFSDVTAAYQWYAYRRCGMLIGNTEEPSANGKNAYNAQASFLTCSNVDVYYGNWTEYTYYQFTNQTDAQGNKLWYSNYPWVRAEKGERNGILSNVRYGNPIINGTPINTVELAEANCTSKVTIEFKQLYGGGQGVYGCNDHVGVRTHVLGNTSPITVYVENNLGWSNLRLKYWLKNPDNGDKWTTISDAGIGMGSMEINDSGIYKIDLPYYAYSVQIIGNDGEVVSNEKLVSELASNEEYNTYTLAWTHAHQYVDGVCSICNDAHDCLQFVTGVSCKTSANCSKCNNEVRLEHDYKYVATDAGSGYKSQFHRAFAYKCTKCGDVMKSFTVGSGTGEINTFTMPVDGYFAGNRWNSGGIGADKGEFGKIAYDEINKVYYVRIHLANGGSFELINNSAHPDNADNDGDDPDITQTIYGTGRYAVIKMRVGANEEYIRFGAMTESNNKNAQYITDTLLADHAKYDFKGGWAVYVIDLSQFSKTYTAGQSGETLAWFGLMGDSTGGTLIPGNDPQSSLDDTMLNYDADDYVDIAYFAVCDDKAEIAKIVTDDELISTGWIKDGTDGTFECCEHAFRYVKDGNFYKYQCTSCQMIKASFKVGADGINTITLPGLNFGNRYATGDINGNLGTDKSKPFGVESFDSENGVYYTRIQFTNGGSFEFLNGSGTAYDTSTPNRTQQIYGSGRYAVIKLRVGPETTELRFAAVDGTKRNDVNTPVESGNMLDGILATNKYSSFEEGWAVYVIDFKNYNICSAYTYTDKSIKNAWFGIQGYGTEANLTDQYVDIAYFALCDTWTEVDSIIDAESVIVTDWNKDQNDDDTLTYDAIQDKIAEEQGYKIP